MFCAGKRLCRLYHFNPNLNRVELCISCCNSQPLKESPCIESITSVSAFKHVYVLDLLSYSRRSQATTLVTVVL